MKKGRILLAAVGAAALVAVLGVGSLGILYQTTGSSAVSYYGRIDNSKVESIPPHGGMNYRYHMTFYAQDGTAKEMDLDTSRVLREGAFLRVEVAALRGVTGWEEMQYDQLPAAVQGRYEP